MSETPSEARIEDRESEAINKGVSTPLIKPKNVNVNVVRFDTVASVLSVNSFSTVYFGTLHPYPKDKKACFHIGKVYDKLKKYFTHMFITKELTKKGIVHFHILCSGMTTTNPPKSIPHNKLWITQLSRCTDPKPDTALYETSSPEEAPDGNAIDWHSLYEDDLKKYYIGKYYSILDQVKFIVNYMTKEEPESEYDTYLLK